MSLPVPVNEKVLEDKGFISRVWLNFLQSLRVDPTTGGSGVSGPATSVVGDIASFNNTLGSQIKDSGLSTVNVSDAVAKKHSQNTDQYLDYGGSSQVSVVDVKDAVAKKHTRDDIIGYREGLNVTIKDASNLYIDGGSIEIGGSTYALKSQLTVPLGTVVTNTMYFIYVQVPSSGVTLAITEFSISTTVPVFNDSLGALYKTGDATKRYVARYYSV
jgi:hypothetical protein